MSFDARLTQLQFRVQERFPDSLTVGISFLKRDSEGCRLLAKFLMQVIPDVFGDIHFKAWTGAGPPGYLLYGVEFDTEQLVDQELVTESELGAYFSHGLLGLDWLARTWTLPASEGDELPQACLYTVFDSASAELYHNSGSAEEIMNRLQADIETYLEGRRFITEKAVIKRLEQRLNQAATEIQLHGYREPRFVQLYFYIGARLRAADALVLAGFYPDALDELQSMVKMCRELLHLPALKQQKKRSVQKSQS